MVSRTSGTLDSDDTGLDADLDYSQKKIPCQLHNPWKSRFSDRFIQISLSFPLWPLISIAICTSPRDRE